MFGRVALRDCELSKVLRLESVLSLEESVLELAPENKVRLGITGHIHKVKDVVNL